MKMLHNKGPKIKLCGTPNNTSLHELYLLLLFAFYLRGNYLLILRHFLQNHMHTVWQLKVH